MSGRLERDEDDQFRAFAQLEHMQGKYTGTGHADMTRHEWAVQQHRDSYAAYVAHRPLLSYISIAQNESLERCRYDILTKMVQPCGPKPKDGQLAKKVKTDKERLQQAEQMLDEE